MNQINEDINEILENFDFVDINEKELDHKMALNFDQYDENIASIFDDNIDWETLDVSENIAFDLSNYFKEIVYN